MEQLTKLTKKERHGVWGHGKKPRNEYGLTVIQQRALELMARTDLDDQTIAQELGVTPQTMRNWLQKDHYFKLRINELDAHRIGNATRDMITAYQKAVTILLRNLDGDDSVTQKQLRSANIVCSRLPHLLEAAALNYRLVELENHLLDNK